MNLFINTHGYTFIALMYETKSYCFTKNGRNECHFIMVQQILHFTDFMIETKLSVSSIYSETSLPTHYIVSNSSLQHL